MDLTNKTLKCDNNEYYVYSSIVYNAENYCLVSKNNDKSIKDDIKIFRIINSEEMYLDDNVPIEVISKFILFLTM